MRNAFISFLSWMVSLFKGNSIQCEECGNWDTERGLWWARGWNELCSQAYSDDGAYCHKCQHVTFVTPLEEHVKQIPDWCKPYR